jgi:hypothetical protein
MALAIAGVVSPAAVQQQQQQEVLMQTRLTVRRKTDADVATGEGTVRLVKAGSALLW